MKDYTIIKDLRILNAISKRYNLEFDRDYKYCIRGDRIIPGGIVYKSNTYRLKYFDGCFYPYLVTVIEN